MKSLNHTSGKISKIFFALQCSCCLLLAAGKAAAQAQVVPDASGIVYVKPSGTGSGSSWSSACSSLADALAAAAGSSSGIRQIWVAEGTYKPNRPANNPGSIADGNRNSAFVLAPGVKLYGGFPANADDVNHKTLASRSWWVHPTVLSGDLNGDDVEGDLSTNKLDNAYHVVVAAGSMIGNADTARLDGFTIAGGNASANNKITVNGMPNISNANGGGIYVSVSQVVAFANIIVSGNKAREGGGGIQFDGGSSVFTGVKISNNTATNGGGMLVIGGTHTFTNLYVGRNSADYGGGIYTSSTTSSTFTNVLICGNTAVNSGGGVNCNGSATATCINTTIANNYTNSGQSGGVNIQGGVVNLCNSIVWGNNNKVGNSGKNVSNGVVYDRCLVEGGAVSGTGIISNADPLFVTAAVATTSGPAATEGNFHLRPGSPALDAGSGVYAAGVATDLAGDSRVQGYSMAVDLGAYERSAVRPDANGVVYVKQGGTGSGCSWADAHPSLSAALAAARNAPSAGDVAIRQIWVAEGVYKPNRPMDNTDIVDPLNRKNTFLMAPNVKVYGGFPKNADDVRNSTLSSRDWRAYPTVLSGDLAGNDVSGNMSTNKSDNTYHVVVAIGSSKMLNSDTARLDGFVVTGGYADGKMNKEEIYNHSGGGIYATYTTMLFTNDSVTGNFATGNSFSESGGGGIYLSGNISTLTNMSVCGNISNGYGGGVACIHGTNNPKVDVVFTGVRICGNTSRDGGGGLYLYVWNKHTFVNMDISNNVTTNEYAGGVYHYCSDSVTFISSRISGNVAKSGGGFYHEGGTFFLLSVLISGNVAIDEGGGMCSYSSMGNVINNATIVGNYSKNGDGGLHCGNNTEIQNTIIYGNNPVNFSKTGIISTTCKRCLVQGGTVDGTAIISNSDPRFVNLVAATGTSSPTTAGDYRLQSGSPAIDKGNNSLVLAANTTDVYGNTRIQGCSRTVDLGAHEYGVVRPNAKGVIYVKQDGGTGEGSSWSSALASLSDALVAAASPQCGGVVKQIWVAEGTYKPTRPADNQNTVNATDRKNSFVLAAGVKVYGGFPANAN
ncbi:MAG: hypothetical protein LBH84_08945, partial [Prevotellaceae bacterium]|nr:hypothetical protein [Prevotellaceae bacterium]